MRGIELCLGLGSLGIGAAVIKGNRRQDGCKILVPPVALDHRSTYI